jgi:hypothetical protein
MACSVFLFVVFLEKADFSLGVSPSFFGVKAIIDNYLWGLEPGMKRVRPGKEMEDIAK